MRRPTPDPAPDGERALEPVGERLQREVVADVERQPRAGVLDQLERGVQRVGVARVGAQLLEPVGGERELLGVGGQAGEIAVPEADELERVVERAGLGAPRGAAGALAELGLLAPVLLLGQVLELGRERRLELGLRGGAGAARGGQHLRPRLDLADVAGERGAGERLGARPQRRPVAERERARPLAVAEREPRAGLRALAGSTPRDSSRSASRPGGGASKRTPWQREVIVGSTCDGRSVSRISTT